MAENTLISSGADQNASAAGNMKDHLGNLLASIVESSGDAIISNSCSGLITSWNTSAERIFGYTAQEAIGKNISLIVPVDRRDEALEMLGHLRCGNVIKHFETVRVGKDGRGVDISLTVSPIRNNMGDVTGGSIIARDITERKDVENRLLSYTHELEKSHQALSDYTHTVSHDLKAPLRRIVQYCEVLKEDASDRLSDEGARHLIRLVVQAKRLQKLVDDLLAYAQVLSVKEEKQETDLDKLLREVTDGLETLLKEYKAVVNIGTLPTMKIFPMRVRQLFQNLIVNAIKYHNNRDPVINVECHDKGDHYLFSFEDNGIGIAGEFHKTIFSAFERLHTQEEIEGSGLGLSICAKAVEMHGGRIWVVSTPGEGAVFYFTLQK